jgi:hypothetical protein
MKTVALLTILLTITGCSTIAAQFHETRGIIYTGKEPVAFYPDFQECSAKGQQLFEPCMTNKGWKLNVSNKAVEEAIHLKPVSIRTIN